MIKYSLTCPKSHSFEGWFPSGKGFDAQVKKKLVACPMCGSTKISKALMAPRVLTSEQKTETRAKRRQEMAAAQAFAKAAEAATTGEAPATPQPQMTFSPEQREMLRELKKLRDKVLAKSEYVGPRFAEEARRIHQENEAAKEARPGKKGRRGKAKDEPQGPSPRGIHGEASPQEVKALLEDGIEVFPIPVLPDDKN